MKFYFNFFQAKKALNILTIGILFSLNQMPISAKPIAKAKTHRRSLQDYEAYLGNIKTLMARIEQQDSKGHIAKGILYIKKPGKMRLTYLPERTVELMTVEDRLVKYDWRTKESDSMALSNTPLQFLMQASGKFTDHATVEQWISGSQWTQIILRSKQDPEAGQIKLIFQEKPFRLYRWVLVDVNGNKTIVTLKTLDVNIHIDSQTFEMKAKKE